MNTEQIFELALKTAGLKEAPADSGVLVAGENIKKVAFGVDIDVAELILAKELGFDCVITHHPQGSKKVDLYKVMDNQIDRMVKAGVPINKAEKALAKRKGEVDRSVHVSNYDRVKRAAELMQMPFIGIHSPADLMVEDYMQNYLDENLINPRSQISDVINLIKEIPEYKNTCAGPIVRVGANDNYAGKVFVTMAGGTGGGEDVFKAYFEAGVGSLIVMHVPENVIEAVKKQNIGNIIVAGHMASDSLGINLIIKGLEQSGLEITRMAGVIEPC